MPGLALDFLIGTLVAATFGFGGVPADGPGGLGVPSHRVSASLCAPASSASIVAQVLPRPDRPFGAYRP